MEISRLNKNLLVEKRYDRPTIQQIAESLHKRALASMIKADIRNRFPEPYASMYCRQFVNFKNVADFFEYAAKLMRR